MLFLIFAIMFSAVCVVFFSYDDVYRALFCFLSVTKMISVLCVVFDCYDNY